MVFRQALLAKSECIGNIECNYNHMCWYSTVPIDQTGGIQMLYVFVDIKIDTMHFLDTIRHNFPEGSCLALVCTIQFVAALQVSHQG